ncbi:hypothetical protein Bbelb_072730 [Branchiostoma belcheri]|nr:hypothetical protein Bbelb_072730 [Branchiostoma belcheri]
MATATSSRSSTVVLIARNAFTGHLLIPRRHQGRMLILWPQSWIPSHTDAMSHRYPSSTDTFTVDVQENLYFLFHRSEPFSVPLGSLPALINTSSTYLSPSHFTTTASFPALQNYGTLFQTAAFRPITIYKASKQRSTAIS